MEIDSVGMAEIMIVIEIEGWCSRICSFRTSPQPPTERKIDEDITVKTVEALYMQFNFGFVWGPLDLSDCLFFQSITTCISNGFLHLKIIILFLKYFKYINIFLS